MMYRIKRNLIIKLENWYKRDNRKPLVLRGARQTGKTSVVRDFGTRFSQFVELNMELLQDRKIFEQELTFDKLLQALFLQKDADRRNPSTLLFIDEIQHSPQAVALLRYFYEKAPQLAVICTGSLLDVYSESYKISFPVGRVENLYLYPVTFDEYLDSLDNSELSELYRQVPLPDFAHSRLLELFHEYSMVGGMPEITSHYLEHRDLQRLQSLYNGLISSFIDDAAKYSSRSSYHYISHVIESAPAETGNRITYQGFGNSTYRSREIGEAFRILEKAMLLYRLYPVTGIGLPQLPSLKKAPRLLFIDVGLMNYALGIQHQLLHLNDLNGAYAGKVTEQIVGQLLLAESAYHQKPLFWVREKKGATSEVDFVYQGEKEYIPIEVKSGKTGTLRSLHQFMGEAGGRTAVRFYSGPPGAHTVCDAKGEPYTLLNLPYFLVQQLPEYLDNR